MKFRNLWKFELKRMVTKPLVWHFLCAALLFDSIVANDNENCISTSFKCMPNRLKKMAYSLQHRERRSSPGDMFHYIILVEAVFSTDVRVKGIFDFSI